MDSPQYFQKTDILNKIDSFKPYYKWIVLNTLQNGLKMKLDY